MTNYQKVTLQIPISTMDKLQAIAQRHNKSMTTLHRQALALVILFHEEVEKGHAIEVVNNKRRVVKEVQLLTEEELDGSLEEKAQEAQDEAAWETRFIAWRGQHQ